MRLRSLFLLVLVGCSAGASASSSGGGFADGDAGDAGAASLAEGGTSGTPPPTQDVSPALAPARASYGGVPGLAAIVMRGNDVIALGANGVRKAGDPTPLTTSDPFELGENVQAMTATLAATLVEAGTLSWTTRLGDVITDASTNAQYRNATLDDLLAQRAGAPALIPMSVDAAARSGADPAAARASATTTLLGTSPDVASGTFHGSNASFLFANAMMERASGAPWEKLVASNLYAPLGITTCKAALTDLGATPTIPWGHVVDDTTGASIPLAPGGTSESPAAFAPTSALRCSITDWAKFAVLHLIGARKEQTTILSASSFAKLQTPYDITHALGWNAVSRTWAGETLALTYESATSSSYAIAWILPDKNAVVLVAVNQGGAAASKVADEAVADLVGQVVNGP